MMIFYFVVNFNSFIIDIRFDTLLSVSAVHRRRWANQCSDLLIFAFRSPHKKVYRFFVDILLCSHFLHAIPRNEHTLGRIESKMKRTIDHIRFHQSTICQAPSNIDDNGHVLTIAFAMSKKKGKKYSIVKIMSQIIFPSLTWRRAQTQVITNIIIIIIHGHVIDLPEHVHVCVCDSRKKK